MLVALNARHLAGAAEPLFPRLSYLLFDVTGGGSAIWTYLPLFFGPALSELALGVAFDTPRKTSPGSISAIEHGLSSLPRFSPHLSTLRLNLSDLSGCKAVTKLLSRLPSLHVIDLRTDPISSSRLLQIMSLSSLDGLGLQLSSRATKAIKTAPQGTSNAFFAGLRSLDLRAHSLKSEDQFSCAREFLEQTQPKNLESISLSGFGFKHDEECYILRSLCRSLVEIIPPDNLKSFTVICKIHEDLRPMRILFDRIEPLLSFHKLEIFSFTCRGSRAPSFHLDDNKLEQCAIAWPQLRQLVLIGNDSNTRRNAVRPSFLGLRSLVSHCRHLEILNLDFDLSDVCIMLPLNRRPAEGLENRLIQKLGVRYSHAGDGGAVAAVLLDLFPNLASVDYHQNNRDNFEWDRVNSLLPVLSAVRGWGWPVLPSTGDNRDYINLWSQWYNDKPRVTVTYM